MYLTYQIDLYTKPLPTSLLDDIDDYSYNYGNRFKGYLQKCLYYWFLDGPKDLIHRCAKVSVRVLDNLLYERVPFVCI